MFGIAIAVIVLISLALASVAAIRHYRRKDGGRDAAAEGDLPPATAEFGVRTLSDKVVSYGCGHDGPLEYLGIFFGQEMRPTEAALQKREKCPACVIEPLRQEAIHCALCGLAILPGEPVALYAGPKSAFRKEPGWVVKHDGQAVGCLRCDCCPSGGFFAGHWDGRQVVSAFPDGGCAAAECLRTGQVIVCGDTRDPDSIKRIDLDPDREPDND